MNDAPHNNCWCPGHTVQCGKMDCPRRRQVEAEKAREREFSEALQLIQRGLKKMTPEDWAEQRRSWGRQDKD